MEQYKLIDMFDKLDTSILEELHLEKDLKRHIINNHIQVVVYC